MKEKIKTVFWVIIAIILIITVSSYRINEKAKDDTVSGNINEFVNENI